MTPPAPRPSSAERWIGGRCRGYTALSARYPDTPTAAAERGTRLHEIAAGVLRGNATSLAADDAKVVEPYVADVRREVAARPGAMLQVEKETQWPLIVEFKGTPDAALFDSAASRVVIWDLKTGWRLVEVFENWQLLCYAVMLLPRGWTAELRVAQPLPYHPDGIVRSWTVTWDDVQRYALTIAAAIRESREPDAPLRPGRHCIYCEALVGCPAAREVSLAAVEYALHERGDLPDEHIGRELSVLREADALLKLRIAALEEVAEVKIREGQSLPGVILRENGRGSWKWGRDEAEVRAALGVLLGKDPAIPRLPTPTQLREAGVPKNLLQPFTEYQPGKLVVATDADDRARKTFGKPPNMEHVQK